MAPLPNTVVIPEGWSAHHRPVSTAGQTGTCDVARPGSTSRSFDSTTGAMSGTAETPYLTGARCRVDSGSPEGAGQDFGDQNVTTVTARIMIDWTDAGDVVILPADVIRLVTVDDNGDPTMIGRSYVVVGVARATLEWERVVGVRDNEG